MKYILKKIIIFMVTLLIVSVLAFLAFQIIPGDPATSMLGTEATPEKIAALRQEMGLNQPITARYMQWLSAFVQGDMGTSYSYKLPVSDMVVDKIPITVALTVEAFLMILLLSIPLGIYAAKHKDSKMDKLLIVGNQIMMAVPPFFLGILLTFLFGLVLQWFTPGGYISYKESVLGFLGYLLLPAISIALPKCAMTGKLLRGSVIEESRKDYVRTAYIRGNSVNGVLYRHVLKNAIIPVVTFLAMVLADIVAGSIIIEQVFGIPGLGRLLISSIQNRDYPVVQAIIIWIALIVLLSNLTADILHKVLDARVELTA